jgi:hypothetical protein
VVRLRQADVDLFEAVNNWIATRELRNNYVREVTGGCRLLAKFAPKIKVLLVEPAWLVGN